MSVVNVGRGQRVSETLLIKPVSSQASQCDVRGRHADGLGVSQAKAGELVLVVLSYTG